MLRTAGTERARRFERVVDGSAGREDARSAQTRALLRHVLRPRYGNNFESGKIGNEYMTVVT